MLFKHDEKSFLYDQLDIQKYLHQAQSPKYLTDVT